MTNQEFFDAYVRHLRKQGQRAQLYGCVYSMTDENGNELCCGVGGVIPKELRADIVSASQNRMAIQEVMQHNPRVAELFRDVNPRLLADAQQLHDVFWPELWERKFSEIAKKYSLKVPE
jgi:hypothetical protein